MNVGPPYYTTDLTPLQLRRVLWRMAKGLGARKAILDAGLGRLNALKMLAHKSFQRLVRAYRTVQRMGEDARRASLVSKAMRVLEEAMIANDKQTMIFVTACYSRGHDPAELLADGVMRSLERTVKEPEQPMGPPNYMPPREPGCPIDSMISSASAKLREQILDEVEIEAVVRARKEERLSDRAPVSLDELSPQQAVFLERLKLRKTSPTGSLPELSPNNPNAPNN